MSAGSSRGRPACLPLTGAPLVAQPPGERLRLPASPGAVVYAIVPGVVTTSDPLVIRADDGCSYHYDDVGGGPTLGARVAAGQPVATLRPGEGPTSTSWLTLTVTAGDGRPVDAYELLVGLPDPAEYAPWTSDADPELLADPAYRVQALSAGDAAGLPPTGSPGVPSAHPGAEPLPARLADPSPTPGPDEWADYEDDDDDSARAAALLLGRPRPSGPGAGDVG